MFKKKGKILIALSGGVDSAVSAALLVAQGYQVTAAYMVNYEGQNKLGETCWVPEYRDAVRVAAALNIPILKLDFVKEYKQNVLDYMYQEYEKGNTPNPDVLCNKFVKFGAWLEKAKELGFDYLATGHYANIKTSKHKNIKTHHLMQAKDDNKDQTYFLHQLSQEQLQYVMFPIGKYTKPQVRKIAKKFKLPVADKEESMGICFVGEVPMKEFLMQKIKPTTGKIIMYDRTKVANIQPKTIGEHDGLPFYTIGQRHVGAQVLQLGGNTKPLYVVAKNFETNELVVGFEDDPLLYKEEAVVENVNWINIELLKFPLKCQVRLRHRQPLQDCTVEMGERMGEFMIKFKKPQRAVTPGQFAVFFKKGECLGGGAVKNF
jgi:tRNA-specific 2-thiouridylase